ncbi:MAG TPA: hypothetical protein VGS57_06505 [Thermoanaerobaculia bacterium]|nr:hypothetical protein [Thermoanaerobaculia bacterium]
MEASARESPAAPVLRAVASRPLPSPASESRLRPEPAGQESRRVRASMSLAPAWTWVPALWLTTMEAPARPELTPASESLPLRAAAWPAGLAKASGSR